MTIQDRISQLRELASSDSADVSLHGFRAGWLIWCTLGDKSDCLTGSELMGYQYAADCNDMGGERPTVREGLALEQCDIDVAVEWS